jgi:hypothetical protein
MATVATKVEPQESEACGRLRQAVSDVTRQLKHPSKSELTQATELLDRYWVQVSKELLRLAKPLTPSAPDIMGTAPGEPTPARVAQQEAIDQLCRLLDAARSAREQALQALFQLR